MLYLRLLIISIICLTSQVRIVMSAAVGNLTCYDCFDSFKNFWDPFTPCQRNLSAVRLRQCHVQDRYCKVERISLKSITISISRGCVSECFYGCKAHGYGITQLRCTSCCQGYACNTDNGSGMLHSSMRTFMFILTLDIISQIIPIPDG
ncbi:hypothetical protein SNE40_020416 [Patella caerulea]|uniref:Snake toxin/toxin-like domain-containing protein n=2 Tax=Patella caerulea TaxID=87958 RepID=A0AAN8GHQ1_PATCE